MNLLPLKKKSDARADSLIPPWHPNLRIATRLPDIKVVRTAFFVLGSVVVILCVLALYLGVQEWNIRAIEIQVEDLTHQINRDRLLSVKAVQTYALFKEQEAMTLEVEAFTTARISMTHLLVHVGQTLPNKIALDQLDVRSTGVVLRATVRGAPDRASGDVSTYLDQLHRDPEMSALFSDITLTGLNRSADSGRITIEISMPFKPAAGAKK